MEPVGGFSTAVPSDVMLLSGVHVKVMVRLFISYSGTGAASNVTVTSMCPSFVHMLPSSIVIESVRGGQRTPTVVKLYFYALKSCAPSLLEATIVVTFSTAKGEPRVATHPVSLPLMLACRLRAPTKTANYKIVVDTEVEALSLLDVFDDYLYGCQESGVDVKEVLGASASIAMGFQFWACELLKKTGDVNWRNIHFYPPSSLISQYFTIYY